MAASVEFYSAWQPVQVNAGEGPSNPSGNSGFWFNGTGLQWSECRAPFYHTFGSVANVRERPSRIGSRAARSTRSEAGWCAIGVCIHCLHYHKDVSLTLVNQGTALHSYSSVWMHTTTMRRAAVQRCISVRSTYESEAALSSLVSGADDVVLGAQGRMMLRTKSNDVLLPPRSMNNV